MRRLFKNLAKGDWIFAAISLVCIVGQVYLDLRLPDYMSEITTLVETEGSEMSDILQSGGLMLSCALGSLVLSIIVTVLAAKIATHFSAVLRKKIFDSVQSFSMEEIGHFSTASLITRSTNDIILTMSFSTTEQMTVNRQNQHSKSRAEPYLMRVSLQIVSIFAVCGNISTQHARSRR